ncbi:MAG: NAD(+)/NADH kinase [Candidatus Delongbacteria bacterium]|nr:NAD(+)/NADH kinase [Candidatus Delongbacteria bacterium]
MAIENAIVIINKTRLEQLVERFNTKAQAKFYIEHSGGDFADYELEHSNFNRSLEKVQKTLSNQLKHKIVERKYLPNFLFSDKDIAIVVGQDGLVANTAKYVNGLPILAINPDIERFDGFLLPFNPENFEYGLLKALENRASFKKVTMAEAQMNDGQKLLAFNDFFIGPSSHISARYRITHKDKTENHSSSGIIVSTGAGSTGWLSSLINMTNGITSTFSKENKGLRMNMKWEDNKLVFIVREPFQSKHSEISLTAGLITKELKLRIESLMPSNGLIFSDGIEADFLNFNSGSIVEIGLAKQKAMIINN